MERDLHTHALQELFKNYIRNLVFLKHILKGQPVAAGGWSILLTQLVKRLIDSESEERNEAVSFGTNNPVNVPQIVLYYILIQLVCSRCHVQMSIWVNLYLGLELKRVKSGKCKFKET